MPIVTAEDYIASLRGRKLRVFLFGERVEEPVDHPVIRPSINAVAETYRLATEQPGLATAESGLGTGRVNRFLQITRSADEVVAQNRMQRALGQRTGTCFQRCVGMDALNALDSVTFDTDRAHGTSYRARFLDFVRHMQRENYVVGGAMTDAKGDRSRAPSEQADPDLFLRVVERRADGVVLRGAKLHQTGCLNSHWLVVMPTQRLGPADRDWAVVAALPVTAPGLTFIYGRQSSDSRALEGAGAGDVGNLDYGGQEAMIVFDDVFVPHSHVFLDGEHEQAATLVERCTTYHRRSYVCKAGVGDALIGAAATLADYHGVAKASHVRDKLVEMAHLNETIYGTGMASSHASRETSSGNFLCDETLANVCKHHVTRFPFEIARLAQDLAGGLVGTLPSAAEFASEETGPLLRKYLAVRPGVSVEARRRMLRLVENMTMGRNAVGYLTESVHGAGSPQAQRVQLQRLMRVDEKQAMAKRLAGVTAELERDDQKD
jgi:4-hydroxybutyryl-CoA dehydratase / vinylacetyl-CoA-Delta-isomerase